jgi:hypothetical protein
MPQNEGYLYAAYGLAVLVYGTYAVRLLMRRARVRRALDAADGAPGG